MAQSTDTDEIVTWTLMDPNHTICRAYPENPPFTAAEATQHMMDTLTLYDARSQSIRSIGNLAGRTHLIRERIQGLCNTFIITSRNQQAMSNADQWHHAMNLLGISRDEYENNTTPEQRAEDRRAFSTKKSTQAREFYRRLLQIVSYWFSTPAGRQFIQGEREAGRMNNDIEMIENNPVARLRWKYWVQLNVNTLARHLFGYVHDSLVPAFWLSEETLGYRQQIACLIIDLGSKYSAQANNSYGSLEAVRTILKDDRLKLVCHARDHYTKSIPMTWMSASFPNTRIGSRRTKREIYDFTDLAIAALPETITGEYDIPESCTWP